MHYKTTNETSEDYFFNMTYDISNSFADAVGECYDTGYGFYVWGLNTYSKFNSAEEWGQAFLQNIVGNIITFNNMYNSINASLTAGQIQQVYFQFGKLFYLLINVQPINLNLRQTFREGIFYNSPIQNYIKINKLIE